MSKSRGNVVNPDEIVKEYGADSLRLYEMFMGPLEATKPWSMQGVRGVRGFLDRAWRMIVDDRAETLACNASVEDMRADRQPASHAASHDHGGHTGHRAASVQYGHRADDGVRELLYQGIDPSASRHGVVHIAAVTVRTAPGRRALGSAGEPPSLAYVPWPQFDEALTKEETVEVPVQIGKKVRAKVVVPADATAEQTEQAARENEKVAELLQDKQILKVIVVPGRLVNFVVK